MRIRTTISTLCIIVGAITACVCAVISVRGLGALFSGAALVVMLLMGSLELGKLVAAAATHLYWERLRPAVRAYLVCALVVLSAITSLGVYSVLVNAWQQSQAAVEQLFEARTRIESDISRIEGRRAELVDALSRLDASVDVLIEYDRATQAEQVRGEQAQQRTVIGSEIQRLDTQLDGLFLALSNARDQARLASAKQGVIAHISRSSGMDEMSAANALALLIIFVADPVAIALLIAGLSMTAQPSQAPTGLPVEDSAPPDAAEPIDPEKDAPRLVTEEVAAPAIDGATHARITRALWKHKHALHTDSGERFLKSPVTSLRDVLEQIAPDHAQRAADLLARFDQAGEGPRRIYVNGKNTRVIHLVNPTNNDLLKLA